MNNSVIKTIPQILKDNICTVFNLLNLFAIEERQPIRRRIKPKPQAVFAQRVPKLTKRW